MSFHNDIGNICDELDELEELNAMAELDADMDDYEFNRQANESENTGLCSTCGREETIHMDAKNQICKGCNMPTMNGANVIMNIEPEEEETFEEKPEEEEEN